MAEPAPGAGGGAPGGGRMFASLRIYNYRLFFVGQGISVAGNFMQSISIAWVVLQLSHNAVVLGAVTAARFAPLVLLGPWGGLIADRSDKRRLLTLTQAVAGLLALLLALLYWVHAISLIPLLCIVIALGLVNVVDNPARQSLINNLVPRRLLGNAVALNSVSMNFSRIVGPGVGGLLIATLGIGACFLINGLSFGAVIASLVAMRAGELYPSQRETRARGQVRAGLRYAVRTPAVLAPLVMVAVAGTFAWEFQVSLPLITVNTFHTGPTAYGVVMSCLGVGSIAGALVAARRHRFGIRSLAWSSMLWGVLIVIAALSPDMPVLYVTIAVVGSAAITFNSSAKTLLQLSSDAAMRGRVMSLWSIAWQGSTVVGGPVVGAVADALGARWGLAIGGIATLVAGAYYVRQRAVDQSGMAPADQVEVPSSMSHGV